MTHTDKAPRTADRATGAAGPLAWRGGFSRLWTAAAVSRLGDALRGTALPLLAYSLTDSPLLISLVTVCGFLPWLLFGLLGGAVADRMDQRRAMWTVDVARGLLMAGFALVVATGRAGIGLLLALAFALTTLQTLFDNAATALLPALVPQESLATANARLLTGQEVAHRFLGGPLAPALIALGAAFPFLADALTYLLAAGLVASLRTPPPARPPAATGRILRRDLTEGVRELWRDRVLRAFCLSVALANTGMGALIATLVVVVKDGLGAGNTGYAVLTTGYGVGTVLGGLCAARIIAVAGGPFRAALLTAVLQTLLLVGFGTVPATGAAAVLLGLFGFAGTVATVLEATVVQQRAPAALLGRISGAFRTMSLGTAPLGGLLGGAAATAYGPGSPALLAAGLLGLAALALLPARPPVRQMPDSAPTGSGQIPHTAP
ncbi:MFS transporter [Streptomyces sp. NPDC001633]|uniref:MFS transporter n=1 Tax=Streptomyces sp. NPDC001633 TaxID=3364595 RepID=UPI00368069BB